MKLNCVDLFAGAGGFSLAAQKANLRVRLAVENNRHALATYRHNFCGDEDGPIVLSNDIKDIDPIAEFRNVFSGDERCDLVLGGPPCQGFSTHRINDAGVGDDRNDLIHTYFEFVRAFQPTAFLMENVPGMLWGRHADGVQRFYAEGEEAGYVVQRPMVLDARDYGLPQRRKRVFVLGVRAGNDASELIWPPAPTHGSKVARRSAPGLKSWESCKQAFARAPRGDENNIHMRHGEALVEAFRNTPKNGGSRKDSGRLLPCHADHDGHKDVYGRIDPRLPAPTMTTACINPSKGRFVHPTRNHGITVRQAARIQTFPDHFVFKGGLIAAGAQVGNAVPVELGRILISHLRPILENARSTMAEGSEKRGEIRHEKVEAA